MEEGNEEPPYKVSITYVSKYDWDDSTDQEDPVSGGRRRHPGADSVGAASHGNAAQPRRACFEPRSEPYPSARSLTAAGSRRLCCDLSPSWCVRRPAVASGSQGSLRDPYGFGVTCGRASDSKVDGE